MKFYRGVSLLIAVTFTRTGQYYRQAASTGLFVSGTKNKFVFAFTPGLYTFLGPLLLQMKR
jgi:hypothetical protein